MKPIVTWIILANARGARVVANRGPGKGLVVPDGKSWQAEPAIAPSAKAGLGHSIAGPGVAAVDQGDPQLRADAKFAKDVVHQLEIALAQKAFDRLVIVAGPHMLGLMRQVLGQQLRAVLVAEIAKDLSALSLQSLQSHLGEVIAI